MLKKLLAEIYTSMKIYDKNKGNLKKIFGRRSSVMSSVACFLARHKDEENIRKEDFDQLVSSLQKQAPSSNSASCESVLLIVLVYAVEFYNEPMSYNKYKGERREPSQSQKKGNMYYSNVDVVRRCLHLLYKHGVINDFTSEEQLKVVAKIAMYQEKMELLSILCTVCEFYKKPQLIDMQTLNLMLVFDMPNYIYILTEELKDRGLFTDKVIGLLLENPRVTYSKVRSFLNLNEGKRGITEEDILRSINTTECPSIRKAGIFSRRKSEASEHKNPTPPQLLGHN